MNMSNREKHAQIKRKNITKNAIKLFKKNGYNDVKVTDICKAANISLGTFYHYYSSKDSIIDDIYQSIDDLVVEKINAMVFSSPITKLISILEQAVCIMQDELGFIFMSKTYYHIIHSKPDYSFSHERKIYCLLKSCAIEGIEHGCFEKNTDPDEIAQMCLRIGRGDIIDWGLRDGSYKLCDLVVRDLKLMLHSLINCDMP